MAIDTSIARRAPAAARHMAEAANRFLDSLNDQRRAAATFPFEGDERYVWNYRPVDRHGLRLVNMTPAQQQAALGLFEAGLSARGALTAREIIALEPILREQERLEDRVHPWIRDPELYYFSIFGEPGGKDPWAWRAGGHHIGLHFTIVDGDLIAPTPLFFGANPAEVRVGPETGKRTLPDEEDLARSLLDSFDRAQKQAAIFRPIAPSDIITDAYRTAEPGVLPRGLAYGAMTGEQRDRLASLIRHYIERTAADIAANEWSAIEQAGLKEITFAWAGPAERGQRHYYAVKGPLFMLEYDNTQNDGNHIHSVWRDFRNDWGQDLLAQHYAVSHR